MKTSIIAIAMICGISLYVMLRSETELSRLKLVSAKAGLIADKAQLAHDKDNVYGNDIYKRWEDAVHAYGIAVDELGVCFAERDVGNKD